MSTVGSQLLSRIIRTGDLSKVIEYGITPADFLIQEEHLLFNTVHHYSMRLENKGAVPGPGYLGRNFPTFELCDDAGMTMEAMCNELRRARLKNEAKQVADKLLTTLGTEDPLRAIEEAQRKFMTLQALGLSKTTDVFFGDALERIVLKYKSRKNGVALSKLSWPWEVMNQVTGGFQEDDYIVLYGRPKNMKSWVLSMLIAWAFNCSMRVLVYTKEMFPDNLLQRVAACLLHFPYQEFRMASLTPELEVELDQLLDYVRYLRVGGDEGRLVCLSGQDVADGGDTIPWLHAKIQKYQPDIVFVDGLYLMSDGSKKMNSDWTRVTNISRAARNLQLRTRIPLVCTVQANRRAAQHNRAELDEIAYADALGQDATIAARVIAEKTQPTIALVMGGSREFKLDGFRIGGVPATDFEYKELLTGHDIMEAKKQDSSTKEREDPDAHVRKNGKSRSPKAPLMDQEAQLMDDMTRMSMLNGRQGLRG